MTTLRRRYLYRGRHRAHGPGRIIGGMALFYDVYLR